MPDDAEARLQSAIEEWLAEELPVIQMHGGTSAVREIDLETGEVVVELGGGCVGCEVADVTSRNIEAGLRRDFPDIDAVTVRVPDANAFGGQGGEGSLMGIDRTEGGRG